jgi:hypothetical protein
MDASPPKTSAATATQTVIRRLVLAIFLFGVIGAVAELLLLGHTEDYWQWAPLLLIALSIVSLLAHAAARRAVAVRIFQAVMVLFLVSGLIGSYLHYQAKVEFKLETNPELAGWELFKEAMLGGTVPPVLAPGMMIQLGLLGLVYAYRHPALGALASALRSTSTVEGESKITGDEK